MEIAERLVRVMLTACLLVMAGGCDKDILIVPVRACVVRGAAFELKEHLEPARRESAAGQVSEVFLDVSQTWSDGAAVALVLYPDVKVINDPDVSQGKQGDIVQELGVGGWESTESEAVAESCDNSWKDNVGVMPPGITVVFMRAFITNTGRNQSSLVGTSPPLDDVYRKNATRLCTEPYVVMPLDVAGRHALISTEDIQAVPSHEFATNRIARTTAHEIGHILLLVHGNGRDDNGNGKSDEKCDYQEYVSFDRVLPATSASLMSESSAWGTEIGPRQRALAREAAKAFSPY